MGRWLPLGIFLALAVLLCAGVLMNAGKSQTDIDSPLIGRPAPDFALPDFADTATTVRKADLLGKPYLVNIWASWCASCRVEHPVITDIAKSGRLHVVGYNYKDAPEDAARWLQQFGNPYHRIIADVEGAAAIDWGIYGAPETFLVDANGVVRWKHVGPVTAEVVETQLWPLLAALESETMITLRNAVVAMALLVAGSLAALHPKDFQSAEEEARYRALAKELRCVMCQNQSLADSPAGVADDMRRQVLTLIREGKTDAEITAFFQARYGDFILYRPEVKPVTWALWFGPALLLLVGAGVVVSVVRRQNKNAPATPPAEDRQEW